MNRRRSSKVNRRAKIGVNASELFDRKRSELLIDGYNLMHVTRFKPTGDSQGELRRCRDGLLELLAQKLPEGHFPRVTVVFDSSNAPACLPSEYQWKHLLVLYAKQENSADDLIAKLIQQHAAPKELIVISSDHRVQVAAMRRDARPVDSDAWYDALVDRLAWEPMPDSEPVEEKPSSMSGDDTAEFKAAMIQPLDPEQPEGRQAEVESPFPEGFFDDLKREFPDELE